MKNGKYEGLTSKQVLESRKQNGENILTPPEKEPWWQLLLSYFKDPIIRILLFAVVLSFGIQLTKYFQKGHADFFEPIGIITAVILATCVSFFNEYKANKEFDILNQFNDTVPVTVIREGIYTQIPKNEIVVGDLIILETGMEVPADGELIEAVSLKVDESKLTGESVPVTKHPENNEDKEKRNNDTYPVYKVLNSTTVSNGHGIIKATEIGDNTEIGKTARKSMEKVEDRTPLEKQLDKLAQLINVVGFSFAGAVFLTLVLRGVFIKEFILSSSQWVFMLITGIAALIAMIPVWLPTCYDFFELLKKEKKYPLLLCGFRGWIIAIGSALLIFGIGLFIGNRLGYDFSSLATDNFMNVLEQLLMFFMISVTLIVVAVPEGLPLSTTISLAYSMQKMMRENVLTKRMIACETMGAVTTICTDKTGTLTRNEMRIFSLNFPFDEIELTNKSNKTNEMIAESISINSTANLETASNTTRAIGNPTEGALLIHINEQGFDYNKYRLGFDIKGQIPFTTEKKYMATYGTSNVLNKDVIYVKGAPEILLKYCQNILVDDKTQKIYDYLYKINKNISDFQNRGMRVLGFAYEEVSEEFKNEFEEIKPTLTWLGFAVINDPVRPEVRKAIQECKQAGIEVKIVTGDNALTAFEIGRQVNIIDKTDENDLNIGEKMRKLSGIKLLDYVKKLKILSRAKPDDKMTLVKALKEQGEVVAVTGDGTNDAPAMNYSNIGIAMGKTGTFVAKETADMVLLDDSFSSIVKGIKWGRSLYSNIQKFILFQLTINVVALLIALIGPFLGVSLPLTVVQMLWVNLIMDTFAALALSTEPPNEKVMFAKPRDPAAFIINKEMAKTIFRTGFIFVIILISLLLYFNKAGITPEELTLFFSIFVFLQFWNMFNARCLNLNQSAFKGLGKNPAFLIISLVILIGQIVMVQFGGNFFRTVPLSLKQWLIIIGGTSTVLWVGEIKRLFSKIYAKKILQKKY